MIDSTERDIAWRHHILQVGRDGPYLAVSRPIERCAMITIDPETAERDNSIMRTVARDFGNEVGEYASILRPGPIHVGDEVYLVGEPAADASPAPGKCAEPVE